MNILAKVNGRKENFRLVYYGENWFSRDAEKWQEYCV